MERQKVFDNTELVSKLHRRHTARLLDKLEEINTPKVALDAVKIAFSQYTDDIKERVIKASRPNETYLHG